MTGRADVAAVPDERVVLNIRDLISMVLVVVGASAIIAGSAILWGVGGAVLTGGAVLWTVGVLLGIGGDR